MSGDYSRQRFDPKNDFSGVLQQQGRVQLDADWNELIGIFDRRLRAETTDILGEGVVPKETPTGFQIQIASGDVLTIGRGRIYVDGLLAENHGKAPLEFDPVLAEQRGTLPVPYNEQPYLPNAPAVAAAPQVGGPHLVYVDVWEREVTCLEDPELIEKAVGVDTTTRLQTVWQVKVLPNLGAGVTCDDSVQAWTDLTASSDGRLSTAAVGVPAETDPCLIPPSGGYRGLENRLYRLEIHDGGPSVTATFKWSRDNASVATNVTAITALDALTVARVGRDSVMRLNVGDWIEVTDDWLEFARQPGVNPQPAGVMAQIKNVDDTTQIITLTSSLPANVFQTDPQGNTDPARHTRIRRWDQRGQVRDTNGNLLADLNAPGSKGVVPVPAPGTSIILEDGVQITFDTPASGTYHIADYWIFAARTADASVESLQQAPPLGVHHHFCRLALVTFPNSVTDCRTLWPPEIGSEKCECTVCVSAESHNQGRLTIQLAIEQVKAGGGGTICLGVGTYNLGEGPIPINISGAHSLTLRGQGTKTILVYVGHGPAIAVVKSEDVSIEKLTLLTESRQGDSQAAIALIASSGVTLQRCAAQRLGSAVGPVVGLGDHLSLTTIRGNIFMGPIGIGSVATPGGASSTGALITTGLLCIQENVLVCSQRGVSLVGVSAHERETRIANNYISECADGGIVATGFVAAGSSLDVEGNELSVSGRGIVVGTSGARILSNSISATNQKTSGDGIVLEVGLDKTGINQCHVIGNRITAIGGIGISIATIINSAMIKNNFINGAVFGGIVMGEQISAGVLSIENNQIANITARSGDDQAAVVGVRMVDTKKGVVAGNAIFGVGLKAPNQRCLGIQVLASAAVQISNNQILDIGPAEANGKPSAGIEYVGTFESLDVVNNDVRRSGVASQIVDSAHWYAVLISGAQSSPPRLSGVTTFYAARTNTALVLGTGRIFARPMGREALTLKGNLLDAYGAAQVVLLSVSGPCTFSDNRCFLSGSEQPAVLATAKSAIVNANHVQGTEGRLTVIIKVPDRGPFTVLGNITTKSIEVNGNPLNAPWAQLNVQGT